MAEKIGLEAVLELNSFSRAVRTYTQSISGMSNRTSQVASSITSSFTSIGSSVLKLGAIATGAGLTGIAVGLGAIATTGLSFNNAMEQAGARIQAFTKDAGLTAEILDVVRARADKTPFSFREMADATAALLPSARQAGVGYEELLAQAEILAASNPMEGMAGASFALKEAISGDFTSIIERFNLSRQRLNELKEQGVPALEAVQIAMSELGLDTDLVTNLANTAMGRWSTFKDTLQGLAGTVTKPIFDTFSSSLGKVNELLAENAPQMQAFASILSGQISEAIIGITSKVMELSTIFTTEGIGGLVTALGITPDAISLISKFQTMITEIANAVSGPLIAAFSGLSEGGLLDSFNQAISFVNEHFAELQGALLGIGAVLAGGIFAALVAGILSLLTPINLIIAGAALLGAAWAGNWGGLRDRVLEAWAVIQPVLSQLVTWLQTNIPVAVQTASDIWINTLQPALVQAGEWINTTLIPALSDMWTWLSTNIPAAVQTVGDVWNTNFLPGLQLAGDFITGTLVPALSNMWDWLSKNIPPAIQTLSDIWTGTLLPALTTGYENFSLMLELFESIAGVVKAVLGKALEAHAGIWKNVLYPAISKVGNILKNVLEPVLMTIGKTVGDEVSPVLRDLGEIIFPLLQEGLDFVTQSIKDLISYFNSLKETVNSFTLPDILTPGSPPPMAYALWDIAKGAGDASKAMAEMNKVSNAFNPKQFIDALDIGATAHALGASNLNDLRDIFKLNAAGVMGILDAGGGKGELSSLLQQQAAIWNVPPSFAQGLAEANGLFDQLIDKYGEIARATKIENLGRLFGTAGSFGGIGSTLADMLREEVGDPKQAKEDADKLIEGNQKLTDTLATQETQLATLKQELATLTAGEGVNTLAIQKKQLAIEKQTESIANQKTQLAILKEELAKLNSQETVDTIQVEKKELAIAKLTDSIDNQEKGLGILRQELEKLTATQNIDTEAIKKKQEAIAKLNAEMGKNQQAIAKTEAELRKLANTPAGRIEFFKAFLEGKIKGVDIQGPFGVLKDMLQFEQGGLQVAIDRSTVQKEYNRLLAEQRKQEELIAKQKELQQKFDFLKVQFDLVKQAKDLGGNLLAGIQLGLNAKVEDLLTLVNRISEAMVDQINADLQIASPSKVMAKIGGQVMAGMATGIERGKSMLYDTIRNIPLLNGSIPQPVFSQQGGVSSTNSNVYNYNFPMTVNTAATASGVMQQYEIKRSMYAN